MKKIKTKMIFAIVLLVSVVPLHSMLSRWSQKAKNYLTRRVSTMPRDTSFLQQPIQQQPIDTSTWSGWFKSLFQRSSEPSNAFRQPNYSVVKTPSSEAKDFSSATTKTSSLLDKITSYFEHRSQENFAYKLEAILYRLNVSKDKRKFTAEDLESAKQLIHENEKFINSQIKSEYSLGYGQALPRKIRFIKNSQPIYSENVVDRVMRYLSLYIDDNLGEDSKNYYSHNLDTIKNYLELATYIARKGGKLTEKKFYEDLYFTTLMPAYRFLHSINSLGTEDRHLKDMREIFSKLDPLFKKLIPGMRKYIRDAQEERVKLDANPTAYKLVLPDDEEKKYPEKKVAREKASREDYLNAKRKRKEKLWRYAHRKWNLGFWNDDYFIPQEVKQDWKNVDFIEDEYVQWLKNPENFISFYYGPIDLYVSKIDSEHAKQEQKLQKQEDVFDYKKDAVSDLLSNEIADTAKE